MEWGLVQIPSLAFPACHTTFVIIFLRFFMCFPICGLCKHITVLCLSLWSIVLLMLLCLAVLQNTSMLSPVLLLVAFLCYKNTGCFLSIFDWCCGRTGSWAGPILHQQCLGLAVFPLCSSREPAGSVARWALRSWVPTWDLLGESISYNHSGKRSIIADIDLMHRENRKGRNNNQMESTARPLHGWKSARSKCFEEYYDGSQLCS